MFAVFSLDGLFCINVHVSLGTLRISLQMYVRVCLRVSEVQCYSRENNKMIYKIIIKNNKKIEETNSG